MTSNTVRPAPGARTVTERVADGTDALTEASPMALITAHAALTHRIHEWENRYHERATDERAKRDLVQAEMLRRMGDA